MQICALPSEDISVAGLSIGPERTPLAACSASRPAPLSGLMAARPGWPLLLRQVRRHARDLEVVHLTDMRLAPFGRWLRRRLGVAVTVDVSPADLTRRDRAAERLFRAIEGLDAAFVFGAAGARALSPRAPGVPSSALPLVACEPPEPPARLSRQIERLLLSSPAGRPVVAIPWTAELAQWRMYRREIMPGIADVATLLVCGVPDRGYRTELRMLFGPDRPLVAHIGPLDDVTAAAVARVADAWLVPWPLGGGAPDADALVRMGLAATGLPVVATDAGAGLEHERNAFLFRHGDAAGVRATFARLFALPARQRHFVGSEFAADALWRYPGAAALEVYGERFEALAGRPRLPRELRASA
ncbi:MAG TPA: hypothetical protein VFY79_04050 [Dehalococcoidia bacterium]|nr:hypothetical protein [Dehalococcoidia bacterium]